MKTAHQQHVPTHVYEKAKHRSENNKQLNFETALSQEMSKMTWRDQWKATSVPNGEGFRTVGVMTTPWTPLINEPVGFSITVAGMAIMTAYAITIFPGF